MTSQQKDARDRAVQVFQHYVRVLFEKAGASASYTGDTSAEIEGIVDDIIRAATPPARTEHATAVENLRRRDRDTSGSVEELRLKDGSADLESLAPDARD